MTNVSNRFKVPNDGHDRSLPGKAFLGLLILITAAFSILFLLVPVPTLLANLADGAGYYLQLSSHAARGRWFTFDGVNQTNGFHPVWMIALVTLFHAIQASPESYFRLAGLMVVAFLGLASFLFHRALRWVLSPLAAAAGGAGFVVLAFANINLMESAIFLFFFAWLFLHGVRSVGAGQIGATRAFVFGLLLGAVILCRLDAGFLAVAIGVAGLLHVLRAPERRGPLRLLVMVVLGTCVLVMPYLLFNLSQFGSPIPISGRLESTFPHTDFRKIMDGLSSLGKVRQVVLVLAIVYWVWRIIFARSTPSNTPALPQSIRFALDVLAVTCLFHAFNEVLFMRWRLYWHFVLLVPFFALLVSGGVDSVLSRISTSSQRVVLLVFCLGVLFEGAYAVRRVTSRRPGQCWRQAMYEASLWIRANTAGTDRIAAATPEIVGFFSGRGAVDLSGLCNNLGIQKAMDSQSLGPYLRASGVKYIFYSKAIDKSHGAGYQPFDLRFDSDYFGTRSELIHFSQSEEVYRSPPASDWGGVPTVFVLWRWR